MCTVLLPPGGYPIAVKYIISYNIKQSSRDIIRIPSKNWAGWTGKKQQKLVRVFGVDVETWTGQLQDTLLTAYSGDGGNGSNGGGGGNDDDDGDGGDDYDKAQNALKPIKFSNVKSTPLNHATECYYKFPPSQIRICPPKQCLPDTQTLATSAYQRMICV